MTTRIMVGHVLDRLADLPAESVHCVVTSPPYYGLRDYGIEPQVWGGTGEAQWCIPSPGCIRDTAHDWQDATVYDSRHFAHSVNKNKDAPQTGVKSGASCRRCNAWRGSLGLEPTLDLYLDHMVEVCREIRRVLRKDGSFWMNMGDGYAGANNHQQTGAELEKERKKGWFGDARGRYPTRATPSGRAIRPAGSGFKPKDLMLIPSRLAIRLQEDGWWVRSDIAWCKRSPMPESVTDRPTGAWEHVFMLTKSAKYYYDAEAVKEESETNDPRRPYTSKGAWELDGRPNHQRHGGEKRQNADASKRNMRNYWELGPEPFPDAHFATFPTEIPRRAILAGTSAKGVCPKCAAPWARIVEKKFTPQTDVSADRSVRGAFDQKPMDESNTWEGFPRGTTDAQTIGWRPTCGCDAGDPVPATVLDCFFGAGTTGLVADQLQRDCIGIELNPAYAEMARRRIEGDSTLFAQVAAD